VGEEKIASNVLVGVVGIGPVISKLASLWILLSLFMAIAD
jgi:hypothetical protein